MKTKDSLVKEHLTLIGHQEWLFGTFFGWMRLQTVGNDCLCCEKHSTEEKLKLQKTHSHNDALTLLLWSLNHCMRVNFAQNDSFAGSEN